MELYSCIVRVGGSRDNEVFKPEVTAADIFMLRHLHGGPEMVVDIKHVGSIKRSDNEQRAIMAQTYGTGEFDSSVRGDILLNQLFGPMGPLPRKIEEVEHMKQRTKPIEAENIVRATEEEGAEALID